MLIIVNVTHNVANIYQDEANTYNTVSLIGYYGEIGLLCDF